MTIPPFVLTAGRPRTYRVTPQDRYDAFWDSIDPAGQLRNNISVAASRSAADLNHYNTIDLRPRFFPIELVYPGGPFPWGYQFIDNKWVYLAHLGDKRFMIEALIQMGNCQYRFNPDPNDQPSWPALTMTKTLSLFDPAGWIDIPYKPGDKVSDFGFFLSPVRLSKRGMQSLLATISQPDNKDDPAEAFVKAKWTVPDPQTGASVMYIALPDPFRWAVDAHLDYYTPLVDEYRVWITDRERQAKFFVASTLKSLMENDDPLGLSNEMSDPDTFLTPYKDEEKKVREKKETAGAYISHCIDSPEFKIVEYSCLDRIAGDTVLEPDPVCIAFQTWGVLAERLVESRPGQYLAARIVRDETRLPGKHIFKNDSSLDYTFPLGRYTFQAVVQIFGSLYVAFEQIVLKALRLISTQDEVAWARGALRRMKIPTDVETIDTILSAQRKYYGRTTEAPRYRTLKTGGYQRIKPGPVPEPPTGGFLLPRFSVRVLSDVALFGIEVVNLVNAIQQYRDAAAGAETDAKMWSLAGASADMATLITDFLERMTESTAFKATTSLAGTIAAICEYKDEFDKAVPAIGERNYGEAVGYGLATVGAASVAVGSGLALGVALAELEITAGVVSAAAPPAAPFIIAGAILIAVGNTIAWALTRNEFEKFAVRCFLGNDHGNAPDYFPWAFYPMPAKAAVREEIVLMSLIGNFRVSVSGSGSPWEDNPDGTPSTWIEITPGYMPHNSVLQVRIMLTFGAMIASQQTFEATMYLYETAAGFEYIGGTMMPLMNQIKVDADSDQKINKVRFPLRPLSLTVGAGAILYKDYRQASTPARCVVRVRLEAGNLSAPGPSTNTWFEVNTRTDTSVNSLDTSKWIPRPR